MKLVTCITLVLVAGSARGEDLRAAAERAAGEIASQLASRPERGSVKVVAVAPFADSGAARGMGATAADAAGARLAQAARIEVLDRAKLTALASEWKLQVATGHAKADDPELLRRAGAQAVLSGELRDQGDRIVVTLRLVATPGGRVLGQAQAPADLTRAAPGLSAVESQDVEVAMRKLSGGLAAGFSRMPGSALYRRLAVLSFTETGELAQKKQLGAVVTAQVATDLRRDHGLLLVERAKLGQVLGELKLQQMVGVDSAQAGQIGKLADAQALVIGSVAETGDRFLVNARIVATQTGETLAAESASVPAAGLVALSSDAVVLRSRSDAVYRSLLAPGWGQFYNRQPVKAWVVIGLEVGLGAAALGYQLSARSDYDKYRSAGASQLGPQPSAQAQRLYDSAASKYRVRDGLLLGMAGVWALNVADAWLSGVDGAAMLSGGSGGARAFVPVAFPGGAGAVAALSF